MSRTEWAALVALLAAGAALRWMAWERAVVLFNDGPRFLAISRAFDSGAWSAALGDAFHPLYPLLVAVTHRLRGAADSPSAWEDTAALVSVLAGTAAVGLLFGFLRDAFGRSPAWIGAGLLAVHHRAVDYASDVQSDALYLALFAAGILLGWRALRDRSPGAAAGAGAASGLAYLTRPEGIGLALALAVTGLFERVRARGSREPGLVWLAALGLAALVCAAPYPIALRAVGGAWAVTQKKGLSPLDEAGSRGRAQAPPWAATLGSPVPTGLEPGWIDPEYLETDGMKVRTASSPAARAWEAIRMLERTARSAVGVPVLLLAGLGLAAARGRPGLRGIFAVSLALLYGVVLYALVAGAGYVSRRHVLPPALPLFGYAGLGALVLGSFGSAPFGRRQSVARALTVAVLLTIAGVELSRQLEPKRAEERAARSAAEWLAAHAPASGLVAAPRQRLGYYAGMPYVPLVGISDEALGPYLSRVGARYVLLDDPAQVDALLRAEGSEVQLLHQVESDRGRAWVLELGR
jgi:hypothetical protein